MGNFSVVKVAPLLLNFRSFLESVVLMRTLIFLGSSTHGWSDGEISPCLMPSDFPVGGMPVSCVSKGNTDERHTLVVAFPLKDFIAGGHNPVEFWQGVLGVTTASG